MGVEEGGRARLLGFIWRTRQFLQMTFPKVNNSTKILNEKKTKNKTTFFGKRKKHKGERQHHRKEAEEGSTTQKEREKVLFVTILALDLGDSVMINTCVLTSSCRLVGSRKQWKSDQPAFTPV